MSSDTEETVILGWSTSSPPPHTIPLDAQLTTIILKTPQKRPRALSEPFTCSRSSPLTSLPPSSPLAVQSPLTKTQFYPSPLKLSQEAKLVALHQQKMKDALVFLEENNIQVGELAEYLFSPMHPDRMAPWKHFFQSRGRVSRILTWWISPHNSKSGCKEVHQWAVEHIESTVSREAERVRKKGILRTKTITQTSISSFNFSDMYKNLRDKYAIVTTRVFTAISTSTRQIRLGISEARARSKEIVVLSSIVSCLSEHSRQNNILKRIFGLYLYASGAQRQVMGVLNHVGLSESYSSLTTKTPAAPATIQSSNTSRKSPGTLTQLASSMREKAREVAATVTFGKVYDNINFADKVAEQVIGRTTAIESGTCATIWPLHAASADDMNLKDFTKAFEDARGLQYEDIELSLIEAQQLQLSLRHCILRIIVTHGGEEFSKFRKNLSETIPATLHKISVHQTPLHPLPTMKIDESTIVGNAEVDEAIVKELQLNTNKMTHVRLIAGDQLSINRLQSLASLRARHIGGYHGFGWGVWVPGLFHAKMADMHGFFVTHWGKPQTGTRNPGSLSFHNTLLRHLPITISSLPNFRTCRDLVFVSLYARILHCLLLVSGHQNLDVYAKTVPDWETVENHAERILVEYANAGRCLALRSERAMEDNNGGDMVLENAILFLRDGLLSREFTDAVKAGDSGRVLIIIKMWAYSFRGNGHSKYAYEMLMLIHNIQNETRNIVLNNWLLNPSGKANSFVEVDLVQEHMNFWIKSFYKAHGPNSTWEWLETISPCVDALRRLATTMKRVLGTDIGSRHAPPDLSRDIDVLMKSLADHQVYCEVRGRQLDEDDNPVVDVVSEGMGSLIMDNVIGDFNDVFSQLQERRRLKPVMGGDEDEDVVVADVLLDTPDPSPAHLGDTTVPDTTPHLLLHVDTPMVPNPQKLSQNNDEEASESGSSHEDESAMEDECLPLLTLDDVALEMDGVEVEAEDWDRDDDIGDDEESPYSHLLDDLLAL